LGPAHTGSGTIAFDPTFGSSSTLLEFDFTLVEPFSLVKVFGPSKLEQMFFLVFTTIVIPFVVQHSCIEHFDLFFAINFYNKNVDLWNF